MLAPPRRASSTAPRCRRPQVRAVARATATVEQRLSRAGTSPRGSRPRRRLGRVCEYELAAGSPRESPAISRDEQAIVSAVAGDDAEARSVEVRDPRVRRRAGPVRRTHAGSRKRPAHVAVGLEGCELVLASGDDEAAEGRPARLTVVAEEPLRAVLVARPRRLRRRQTSSRPGAGSEKSAGCARSTPTTSRISSSTAIPGGLSTAASAATRTAIASAGRNILRRCSTGCRSENAVRHDVPGPLREPRARPGSRCARARASQLCLPARRARGEAGSSPCRAGDRAPRRSRRV